MLAPGCFEIISTSAFDRMTDSRRTSRHVRFVAIPDIGVALNRGSLNGVVIPGTLVPVQTGTPMRRRGPSTRGVVDITQDVRLKFQILQSMPDYIADADDTG
jgi:hypothetical protein